MGVRKRYIVSLIVVAILIIVVGILLAISLLNFPNKDLIDSKEDNTTINDNHNKI